MLKIISNLDAELIKLTAFTIIFTNDKQRNMLASRLAATLMKVVGQP